MCAVLLIWKTPSSVRTLSRTVCTFFCEWHQVCTFLHTQTFVNQALSASFSHVNCHLIWVKYAINRLSGSSITTRWPTTWVTPAAVRVPSSDTRGPWPQQFSWQSLYTKQEWMHLFSTVTVWHNIFPQSSVLCTLCTGVDRIYSPSSFASAPSLSPLLQSTRSDPTDEPHVQQQALAANLCWIREQRRHQTVLQQIYPDLCPQGLRVADKICSVCVSPSLLFYFLPSLKQSVHMH